MSIEDDASVFHANGANHSRRRTCAICAEEAEQARRARLNDFERAVEDEARRMEVEVLKVLRPTLKLHAAGAVRRRMLLEERERLGRFQGAGI